MKEQAYEQLTLFPAVSHASHSLLPGTNEARKMTVTSGLKCLESYKNSGPLGCLVRMCLESSIWHSTRCFLNWKMRVTKSKRLLFRLAVSMPRTSETEFVFWPTPTTGAPFVSGMRTYKTLQKWVERWMITQEECRSFSAGNGGKTNPQLLEWLMGYEQKFTELLPTPRASDYKGAPINRWYSRNVHVERERDKVPESARRISGMHSSWEDWPDEPELDRVVDGVPNRVDRIKCLGNAVVPQQFYPFFEAIAKIEKGAVNGEQSKEAEHL